MAKGAPFGRCFLLSRCTHDVATIKNSILYTIVIRHATSDICCPAAYMFTADQPAALITPWLQFLKDDISAVPQKHRQL